MNFIKKVFDGRTDEKVHSQFVRFGKGEYHGRFIINFWKAKKIKIKTSFEYACDLVGLCSEFGDCQTSGISLSKKDISEVMSKNNIKGNSETKKGGLFYQNNIDNQELTKEQLAVLEENSYFTLFDLEGDGFKLKIKKKLPKPGKDESKIDDKFCQLEADDKFYSKIRDDFLWDLHEGKKISITHTVIISELILPRDEKDFAKIREMAKRKGKIIRKAIIDGNEIVSEKDFEA